MIAPANAFGVFIFELLPLVMMRCRLDAHSAEGCSRPFEDQFHFPLAPEFWGSWSDSWLETDLLVCGTYIVRRNVCSELLRRDYSA
jgi:hypothetical protein